jgi:hypothetical protein
VLASGESKPMDLRPGGLAEFETPLIEFRSAESSSEGFSGNKFYGYRVRFYYRNTFVRVAALPDILCNWQSSDSAQ